MVEHERCYSEDGVRLVLTVDRHGLCPRDDNALFVIARRTEWTTRQSIVSRGTLVGFIRSGCEGQWIATG